MSIRVNVQMSKIMCTLIKIGVPVYATCAICRTVPCLGQVNFSLLVFALYIFTNQMGIWAPYTENTLSFFFANQCMLIKTVFSGKSFPTLLTNKTSPHECLWQWSLCLCLYILAFACFCLLCIKLFFLV